LLTGYTVLFTLIFGLRNCGPSEESLIEPGPSLLKFFRNLEPASRTALWAFAALMIGSLIDNLFLGSLVKRIMGYGPDWDWFIEMQRARIRNYEEYKITSSTKPLRDNSAFVPSTHYGNYLHSELEERERRRSEVEFRTTLAIVLIFPTAMLVNEGGPLWLLTYSPGVVVIIERFLLQGRANSYMKNHLSVEIEDELKSYAARPDRGQHATPATDALNERESKMVAQAEARLAALEKLKSDLGTRGFWKRGSKDPTVQALKDSSLRIYNRRFGGY
jgi:hypothetical protein